MGLKTAGGRKKTEYESSLATLLLLFPRHPDLSDVGNKLLVPGVNSYSALMFS